jgi:hypothetical protein
MQTVAVTSGTDGSFLAPASRPVPGLAAQNVLFGQAEASQVTNGTPRQIGGTVRAGCRTAQVTDRSPLPRLAYEPAGSAPLLIALDEPCTGRRTSILRAAEVRITGAWRPEG